MSLHRTHENRELVAVGELVQAARNGDRTAFGELYKRYSSMVHAIAMARGSLADADDVVQDVFLRALRELASLRSVEAFGSWLAAIARNVATDLHRRPRAAEPVQERSIDSTQHEEMRARAALDAIRRLPDAYRETVMMRLVEGMTGPEIADRTGLTPASVRVNLHRGMKQLRRNLDAADPRTRR